MVTKPKLGLGIRKSKDVSIEVRMSYLHILWGMRMFKGRVIARH